MAVSEAPSVREALQDGDGHWIGGQRTQGHVALLCPSPTVTSVNVAAVIIIAASIFSGFCHGSWAKHFPNRDTANTGTTL